ncbi:hypothetical protein E4T56_gene309 [Termitomyces sp. T112]|nr:hypothetical protein E4T56_gene309 [Termitomyces sp. T112]
MDELKNHSCLRTLRCVCIDRQANPRGSTNIGSYVPDPKLLCGLVALITGISCASLVPGSRKIVWSRLYLRDTARFAPYI